jgi:predicted RNase H-like HicB family nuclease
MAAKLQIPVLFDEEEEGDYTVTSPSVPGCISYGEAIEKATHNVTIQPT